MNGSDPRAKAPTPIGRLLVRFVIVIAVIGAIAFAGILLMLVRNGRSFVRVGTVASLNTDGVLYLPQGISDPIRLGADRTFSSQPCRPDRADHLL